MPGEAKFDEALMARVWEIQGALQQASAGDYSSRVNALSEGGFGTDPLSTIAPAVNMLLDELEEKDEKVRVQTEEMEEKIAFLNKLPLLVGVVNKDGSVRFLNQVALGALGQELKELVGTPFLDLSYFNVESDIKDRLTRAIEGALQGKPHIDEYEIYIGDQLVPVKGTVDPLVNRDGDVYSLLITGTPIVEQRMAMVELQDKLEIIEQQQRAIHELSTPVIQIWDQVLALPLVGILDSQRAQQAMEVVLERIIEEKARIVIIDITGVPIVDSLVANHLAQTMAAIKLIGATGILTGISAGVAQTLVKLGVDVGGMTTRSTLSDGLKQAFHQLKVTVSEVVKN